MKPKHYPHITVAAAITMLLLPASLLLLTPSQKTQSIDQMIAAADAEKVQPLTTKTAPTLAAAASKPKNRPATRIAMLEPQAADHAIALQSQQPAFQQMPSRAAESSIRDTETNFSSAILETKVPKQSTSATTNTASEAFASTEINADPSAEQTAEDDKLNEEMEAALAIRSSTDDSHFESTGHLAMTGPTRSQRSGTMRSPGSARSHNLMDDPKSDSEAALPVLLDEDPFASEPKNPVVDILLQQPSERRPVSKVENLIATTQQPGWPIALIRSDLPDDVWWVQQMVGIRNRSFASRVNFGNDNSLPGSVYHLVIVFLDSADEARRFRIAKQFKDLPEGLRRSREFTFIRK
ncbi:MAG: hypothetical protein ABJZ55_06740 [Fuerstiella sp.]